MVRFKLPDGSYILPRLEAPKDQAFFVVPETDQILRRLKPVADDPMSMARLRTLLADEHNLSELEDREVLAGIGSAIQSGKLVWVGKGTDTAKSTGVGVAQKEAEPAPPPPASKAKEEVIVTPHLEVELKVVLLDRGDAAPYSSSSPKYAAEPTYITCSLTQSPATPIFAKGATLKVEGGGAVEAYEDEKLTKKFDLSKPIPNAKLVGADPLKLWLKGKARGKFTLKLEVESPSGVFKADKPAEQKMGVVELHMTLHDEDLDEIKKLKVDPPDDDPMSKYHDNLKKAKIPDQKAMSDEDKIKKGRLLHVQKGGPHGRAKVILKKLDAACWPDGTDDYEIVLTCSEAADAAKVNTWAEAMELEIPDAKKDKTKDKVKVKDLKAADVAVWIEGKTTSTKELDTRIDLGVAAGKAKKRNGDWARLTIVEITQVKLEVGKDGGKPELWNLAKKRFYINTIGNPDGRKLQDHAKGNKITVSAQVAPAIKGVVVHFMLAGHPHNWDAAKWTTTKDKYVYAKVDVKLKHTDKKDRKDVVHLSAATDAKGVAVMKDLVLSRLGGEKFRIGAYIAQDPYLAKYVEGHADLSKREPKFHSPDHFLIWRRIWVQLSYPKSLALPSRDSLRTGFEGAFVEYKEVDNVTYEKKDIAGLVDYPEWQFIGGKSTKSIINVGSHNEPGFQGLFKAATAENTPKAHMIIAEHQWDPSQSKKMVWKSSKRNPRHNAKDTNGKDVGIMVPPLDGGPLVVSGTWEWDTGKKVHDGPITEDMVTIEKGRSDTNEFRVTIPDTCDASCGGCGGGTKIKPTGSKKIEFTLTLNASSGPWAGSSGTPHCQIVIDKDANTFNGTILHEIGHQFNNVRTLKNWLGLPNHPNQFVDRGGQGSHCSMDGKLSTDPEEKDKATGEVWWVYGSCIMYHTAIGNVTFCSDCKTDLRARNLSDFAKND